jgi:8-oxo-dGTP pyrophosphatase MutT (NUDIX family)
MSEFEEIVGQLATRLGAASALGAVDPEGIRQAAVALVLRNNLGLAEMLIIKRATRGDDHWSGNLALPGGRWQVEDPDVLVTAVRETREEVGIDLEQGGTILGRLETITTNNPLIPKVQVTPFVAVAPLVYHIVKPERSAAGMVLNHEVATAFWVPVKFLMERGRSERFSMTYQGQKREWPAYPTDNGLIWGMTEAMISEFLAALNMNRGKR